MGIHDFQQLFACAASMDYKVSYYRQFKLDIVLDFWSHSIVAVILTRIFLKLVLSLAFAAPKSWLRRVHSTYMCIKDFEGGSKPLQPRTMPIGVYIND